MAKKRKKTTTEKEDRLAIYTLELDSDQMDKLERLCDRKSYGFHEVAYARFAFKSVQDRVNVVAYESGKLVVQGKGTEDFVRDVVEAEITGNPLLGYEEVHHPEWYEPHAGLDEAGKGDLFGPLVSACVIADGDMVREWKKLGIRDSKQMTDSSVRNLEKAIRKSKGVVVKIGYCGMAKYNQLMGKPGANLNRLLAWLHARSLEQALQVRPVPTGLLDQFSKKPLVQGYLKAPGFELQMRTHAESDPVVAAAAICARTEFLRQLKALSDKLGEPLKKGAGAQVKEQAVRIVEKLGPDALGDFAKLHFRTASEALGLPVPPKRAWKR